MPKLRLIAHLELVNLITERTMAVENPGRGSNNVHYLCMVGIASMQSRTWIKAVFGDLSLHLGKAKGGNIVDLTQTEASTERSP